VRLTLLLVVIALRFGAVLLWNRLRRQRGPLAADSNVA
jgi:hypothetical protein